LALNAYFNLVNDPRATVIELSLGADVDTAAFNEITRDLIDRWPVEPGRNVIVDLSRSAYLGSVLLGLLVNIRQRTRNTGGEMIVCSAQLALAKVIRMSNLDRLFPLVASRADASSRL
jgi:anti-anti-sigma factor